MTPLRECNVPTLTTCPGKTSLTAAAPPLETNVPQVALFALFVKIRALVRAICLRREEIDFEADREADVKLLKHRKNLERTARTIQGMPSFDAPPRVHALHGSNITAC